MPQESNNNSISSEIDAIIARAMQEYAAAKGIDPFVQDTSPATPPTEPEIEEVPDIIPANSQSILVEETTSRFSSAIWYDNIKSKTITLAGLGGIGSYVAFLLARMQPDKIIIYDGDVVEAGNLSGQLYGLLDIGKTKANATASMVSNYSNYYSILGFNERFTESSEATDIMICGFDNMEARHIFFNKWLDHVYSLSNDDKGKCLFIDGRLAAENFQVLCMRGDDIFNIRKYRDSFLFSDSEADETICSYKQTSFMANMIASVMVNLFVNFCANECDPLVPRDLPFYTEYTAETMYFKVVS